MTARRLLLIDDARTETASLARTLAREGYSTRRVCGPAEAMRQVGGAQPPDLVLWSASADAGWADALRALKARAEPAFLPVVLLSKRPEVGARIAGLRAGADDVVARPWQDEEIAARVEALLRIKTSQDALASAKQELERQSITDPLTGLFNRRFFQYRLQQEFERCRRTGDAVSLLMIDLDHFKHLNDRYGHPVGDEALRVVASIVSRELRRVDVCARWGGEEFAIIMPSTVRAGGAVVARRVLRALRARATLEAVPTGRPGRAEPIRVTASIGLSSVPAAGLEDADALLRSADAALYRAKAEGRNRVCVAADEERPTTRAAAREPVRMLPALSRLAAAQ